MVQQACLLLSRLGFVEFYLNFMIFNSTKPMKKASSGYNTTLKMNEKEKLRGCRKSITWYHVFQDIWFHFNHTFYEEISIREYINQKDVW